MALPPDVLLAGITVPCRSPTRRTLFPSTVARKRTFVPTRTMRLTVSFSCAESSSMCGWASERSILVQLRPAGPTPMAGPGT